MQALADGPESLTAVLKAVVAAAKQVLYTDRCAVPTRRDRAPPRPMVPLNRTPFLACRASMPDA